MTFEPLRFTSYFYGQTPEARSKAFIHQAVVANLKLDSINAVYTKISQCRHCQGYLNPESNLNMRNHTWTCTFCGKNNDLPIENQNIQAEMKYSHAKVLPPKSIYIVDGSSSARSNEFFEKTLAELQILLKDARNVCVCVLTSMLHVIDQNGNIHTFPDLEGCVIPETYFMNSPLPSFSPLINLPTDKRGPYTYTALEVALKSVGYGGRVFAAVSYKSSEETERKIMFKDDENTTIRGKSVDEIMPLIKQYKQFHVICSFLVCPSKSYLLDAGTLGRFAMETGGRMEYITGNFGIRNLHEVLQKFTCARIVCRLLAKGANILPSLGVVAYNPNCYSTLDGTSFVFPLVVNEKSTTGNVIVQAYVQKMEVSGENTTYIITRGIQATNDLAEIFRSADYEALLKFVTASLCGLFTIGHNIHELEGLALALLKPMLESYRIHVSRSPNRLSTMVLPSSLRFLPLMTLGILKSTVFTQSIIYDERAGQFARMNEMSPSELVQFAYPTLLDITAYVWHGGETTPLHLNDSELKEKKLIILDNGISTWLWIGENLDKELCMQTFNKCSQVLVESVDPQETEQSKRLFEYVKGNFRHVLMGSSSDCIFRSRMVEDNNNKLPSAVGFLSELHKVTLPPRR